MTVLIFNRGSCFRKDSDTVKKNTLFERKFRHKTSDDIHIYKKEQRINSSQVEAKTVDNSCFFSVSWRAKEEAKNELCAPSSSRTS